MVYHRRSVYCIYYNIIMLLVELWISLNHDARDSPKNERRNL